MSIMASSKAEPLLRYLAQVNLTSPVSSNGLNVSVLLSADVYSDQARIITANYGFDGYMGVPGLQATDETSRQAAYDYGVSWQALDPALNAGTRAYYSAVSDNSFLSLYGVPAVLADTIPVVFSHPVLGTTVSPEAFQIELNTGEVVTPLTASLIPNGEYNERQTVVLSGYWGNRLQPDDPDALHPVAVRIVNTENPLTFVTAQGLVSAVGLEAGSHNPYVQGNGPQLVAANLDAYTDLGEGTALWLAASNGNAGSDLYGEAAQFRIRLYTSAGFSPDGIGSILPTEFSRYFKLEAQDESGGAIWLEEAGVDYAIGSYGTVRIVGLADTGPVQSSYDEAYIEDHDNQYDIILSGDRAAIEQISRVHMPSSGDYSPVYNPGGPGNDPASNPPLPFTVPSSPQSVAVSQLIGHDPYVSFVEIDGSVYRDPHTGQPIGVDQGLAIHDTRTGHKIHQYMDPYGRLFYASFEVDSQFNAPHSANHPSLFDPVSYLRQNHDVRDALGTDPDQAWNHYLQYGADEAYVLGDSARSPAPWFDIAYYLNTNPDLPEASVTPDLAFLHFVNHGMMEFRAPNESAASKPVTSAGLLDYAQANPDLMTVYDVSASATELNAEQQYQLLLHFYRWGYAENRPSAPTLFEAQEETMPTAPEALVELLTLVGGAGAQTPYGV